MNSYTKLFSFKNQLDASKSLNLKQDFQVSTNTGLVFIVALNYSGKMIVKSFVIALIFSLTACKWSQATDFISLVLFKSERSLKTRIKEFKGKEWSTFKPVTISWDKYAIPYIKAETDRDLFYATGAVQAHLRGTQLEIFRRLSQGRLSELAGKKTLNMDIFLRTIDVGRRHQEIIDSLPIEIKDNLKAFLRGINDYNRQIKSMPVDLKILGVDRFEPWTLKELVYVHRLMGADVNWKFFPNIVKIWSDIEDDEFTPYWKQWVLPLFERETMDLSEIDKFTEAGSNAYAVSGKKTKSGFPIVGGDPHLGITVPNFWFFIHQDSPSFKTLGIAMPSFPVAAMGRNQNIAWTGTNLWAVSSYLYELKPEDVKKLVRREESFQVRFSKEHKAIIRESEHGPVLSDTPFLNVDRPLALKWVGHTLTKEIEAFYMANKAANIDEFKKSFKDYGVVGLTYVVASKNGDIDRIHVGKVPVLEKKSKKYIQGLENKIIKYVDVDDFKSVRNHKDGFLVSANEMVRTKNGLEVCSLCSLGERKFRIESLLKNKKVSVDDIKNIQQDVYSEDAKLSVADFFKIYGNLNVRLPKKFEKLLNWDFKYTIDSESPYFFEEMIRLFADFVYEKKKLSKTQKKLIFSHYTWRKKVFRAFETLTKEDQKSVLLTLAEEVDDLRVKKWGDVHRFKLNHSLSKIPFIGRFFKLEEAPYPGGTSTVFKAAFKAGSGDYTLKFGAHLRIIFDLSDGNKNYGVLIGGQDGFWGSKNLNDQTSMWLKGEYVKIPFEEKTISDNKVYQTILK